MKKIISMFALVGLFVFVAPTVLIAVDQPQDSNCHAVNFFCGPYPAGVVVVCDEVSGFIWGEILCG